MRIGRESGGGVEDGGGWGRGRERRERGRLVTFRQILFILLIITVTLYQ